jgi:hypothetical protein
MNERKISAFSLSLSGPRQSHFGASHGDFETLRSCARAQLSLRVPPSSCA